MNSIKEHPGHNVICPCETIYPLIQQVYAYGKSWKLIENQLNDQQKEQLDGKSLAQWHQFIYRNWGREKIENYKLSAPSKWPKDKAKEFHRWLGFSDSVLNPSSIPSTTTEQTNLHALAIAAESILLNESFKNEMIQLNKVLGIDQRFADNIDENHKLLKSELDTLFGVAYNQDSLLSVSTVNKLVNVAMIAFEFKNNGEEERLQLSIRILKALTLRLPLLVESSPEVFILLNQIADCSFNGNFQEMIRLERFLRGSYPDIAKRFRPLILSDKSLMDEWDDKRLANLIEHAKYMIGEHRVSLREKEKVLETLISINNCLSKKGSIHQTWVFNRIDPIIGALQRDISKENSTPELDVPKRSRETSKTNPRPQKRPTISIDLTEEEK